MRNTTSPILENFIQMSYPGVRLPPLWQVLYQEAVRGNHMLFRRTDVERYDATLINPDMWADAEIGEDFETLVLRLVGCADLQSMIRVVDSLVDDRRRELYFMYRRIIWVWCNHIKNQLN